MYASKKYKLKGPSQQCLEFFQKKIDVNCVCTLLEQGLKYREEAFVQMCMSFIKRNTGAVLDSNDFLKIENGTLKKIVEHPALSIPEIDLFESVLKWAKSKCKARQIKETPNKLRELIGDVLFHIRFPTMKLEDFSSKVAQLKILTTEEIIQTFTLLSNPNAQLARPLFPIKPRDVNGLCLLEVFSEYQMKNDFVQSTSFAMSFNASITTPIFVKSLIFFVGLNTQYSLSGTVQIIQGTLLGSFALSCTLNPPNYPSEAHDFPLGVCKVNNVRIEKGFFQIIITYTCGDSNFMLIGKERKKKCTCEGISFDIHATSGPLYAIEFYA